MITVGYQSPVTTAGNSLSSARSAIGEGEAPTVDQVASANLAAVAAESADILVATNVTNLSRSLNAMSELAQTDAALISKPQIIDQASSARGLKEYVTRQGDTVPGVASAFGVSSDTVRWANNLTSDALSPNVTLKIPGASGVLYTIKAGDTAQSLAAKYKSDAARIISYNDAEIEGLQPGRQVLLPGGILPENERPGYRSYVAAPAPIAAGFGGGRTLFAGNMYDYGYCTYYVFNRRAELGRPIGSNWGNAITWTSYARSAGYLVNNTPAIGAILQDPNIAPPYGHVAVVERLNDDGSLVVSEMNYAGWNIISKRTIPASQVSSYSYIH